MDRTRGHAITGNVTRFLVVGGALAGTAVACLGPALGGSLVVQGPTSLSRAALDKIDVIKEENRRALEDFLRREPVATACKVGFQLGPRKPFIIALSPKAEQAGLRRGDRVKSLAGVPISGVDDVARAGFAMAPASPADLVVERNGQELTLPVLCAPQPDAWAAVKRALEAAASGDWDTCQAAAVEIMRARGFVSSNALGVRADCATAQTALQGKRQSGTPLARVVYEWRQAEIRERSYEPGGLDDIRNAVLATVNLLRREGFAGLADDLEEQLRTAAQDAPRPE